ncbi:hypothetical protein FFI89_016525 [Bradyrhizobium sp. KBS0727]|uniref:hypothetical protein n=1 Tax=unclassified Bradyrhizobium TaxID=2631580 RepID=UPI00110F63A0|nr:MULTISPECIES: hypothetical protein [unclassified Bradyrhizobium]QDW38607.1 hypothetical protein FFI71_016520 [Bradyrhizobium sp. KBS0725]QDW45211.1 hypothetical protein FFI89_016525 [Bradyrhizobium sp. KBS0727]
MRNSVSAVIRFAAVSCLLGMLSSVHAAPMPSEDRYIAARDVAIAKISKLYDGKKGDEAEKTEKAANADLLAQMKLILAEPDRKGFGPAKLNLDAYSKGDEGFGLLDGLRFDSLVGENGEKADANGSDGKYIEPKAHIIVTTQTLLERWLRGHKDWWGKKIKNVPQQMAAAFKDESFYTQAIPTDSAVVGFNELPIVKPASATSAAALLGGRTQDSAPDAADEVFVSAVSNGKVYVAYGSISPKVEIPACRAIRADYNKKAEKAAEDFQSHRIDKKAYDKLGDVRQQGEDAYKKCFTQRGPQQRSFAEVTKQAQALLAEAMGK